MSVRLLKHDEQGNPVPPAGRKFMYENEIAEATGLMACCNCCDRIIYEDENWKDEYIDNGGYCKECSEESS